MENGTQLMIAILTLPHKQATLGFMFLYITRGSTTFLPTVKAILSACCYMRATGGISSIR